MEQFFQLIFPTYSQHPQQRRAHQSYACPEINNEQNLISVFAPLSVLYLCLAKRLVQVCISYVTVKSSLIFTYPKILILATRVFGLNICQPIETAIHHRWT